MPQTAQRNKIHWVNREGSHLCPSGSISQNNNHLDNTYIRKVQQGSQLANTSVLAFRDPQSFVAGELHNHYDSWEKLASLAPYKDTKDVLSWIKHSVNVFDFFRPYKGDFRGCHYDSTLPPPQIFPNSRSCQPFAKFISDTITERLTTGAISIWGRVNHTEPPHLVMPLTVEPSKPRLCNDDRFLNLWIKDCPLTLDSLSQLPRYVTPNSFQSVCDDKSGYDHVLLTKDSRTFFGFQWAGWYFVSNTIPFGWKSSAYVYHTIGLLASHYFRSIFIPCSLYIDDRHTGELLQSNTLAYSQLSSPRERSLARASSAIFLVSYTLTDLGYFLGLKKSILVPRQTVPYLGFQVDSVKQAFLLLPKKKEKFIQLLRNITQSNQVDVKTLQRFAGKCISFTLAVPGARLFTNEINLAISKGQRSVRPIPISGHLRVELQSWHFLEDWQDYLPWRQETHHQVVLCSDASTFAWGSVLNPRLHPLTTRDYWPPSHTHLHINVKETLALVHALQSFQPMIKDCWVDVFTDSQALIKAWARQGTRSHEFNDALKRLFQVTTSSNIHLELHYVQSALNPADHPSRTLSLSDCQLSPNTWSKVQDLFGGDTGHSVDLMALPSNVQLSLSGQPLPFFSPHPIVGASGVNVFAQLPSSHNDLFSNPYVFPPISLIPPLLRFLRHLEITATVVVPDVRPRRFWWPLLQVFPSFCLGRQGSHGALLSPTSNGFSDKFSLPWDLWVFRFQPLSFSSFQ